MSDKIAAIFTFPSEALADEASDRINSHLQPNLQSLADCPVFESFVTRNKLGREIELAVSRNKEGTGFLYVWFRGALEDVSALLHDVKLSQGDILSASATNTAFLAEVRTLAVGLGMQSGESSRRSSKRSLWLLLLVVAAISALIVALVLHGGSKPYVVYALSGLLALFAVHSIVSMLLWLRRGFHASTREVILVGLCGDCIWIAGAVYSTVHQKMWSLLIAFVVGLLLAQLKRVIMRASDAAGAAMVNAVSILDDAEKRQLLEYNEGFFQSVLAARKNHMSISGDGSALVLGVTDPEIEMFIELKRLNQKAVSAAKKGDHRTAIKHFRDAVAKAPFDAISIMSIGVSYAELGDHARAMEYLNQAVALDPENSRIRMNLEKIQNHFGRR